MNSEYKAYGNKMFELKVIIRLWSSFPIFCLKKRHKAITYLFVYHCTLSGLYVLLRYETVFLHSLNASFTLDEENLDMSAQTNYYLAYSGVLVFWTRLVLKNLVSVWYH